VKKWIFIVVVVLFVIIQFIRPTFANPAVNPQHTIQSYTSVPANIDQTIRRSCYDCHSSETRWPWYAQISPVSWWLKSHVNDGRRELSFSEFGTYNKAKAARKLKESCDQVKEGEMPLKTYLPMHPAAKLTDADRQMLCTWFTFEQTRIEASMTPAEKAEAAKRRAQGPPR
jgi:hypothetical protein